MASSHRRRHHRISKWFSPKCSNSSSSSSGRERGLVRGWLLSYRIIIPVVVALFAFSLSLAVSKALVGLQTGYIQPLISSVIFLLSPLPLLSSWSLVSRGFFSSSSSGRRSEQLAAKASCCCWCWCYCGCASARRGEVR